MDLPLIDDYQRLFLEDTPLLDVRAPVEFVQGAFPTARNLPLLDDDERQAIGIRYKEMGQQQAIELGHELVQGEVKQRRISAWSDFTRQHPQSVLYCFRGGMRSKISQQWIFENTGVAYPRVKGGYKALRRYLIEQLDLAIMEMHAIVLSGRTGTGKTLLLQRINDKIDLEHIYHHRGSAFGKHVDPQPSQIDIENALSIALLKHRTHGIDKLVLEDEARAIGSRRLPNNLIEAMQQAPLVVLEANIDERVANIFQEYIVEALAAYQDKLGETEGFDRWANNLLTALENIQRRLGGLQYRDINSIMLYALDRHRTANDNEHHKTWIYHLLAGYYDPMYDYQLGRKAGRIIFRGDSDSVLDYLTQHHAIR